MLKSELLLALVGIEDTGLFRVVFFQSALTNKLKSATFPSQQMHYSSTSLPEEKAINKNSDCKSN